MMANGSFNNNEHPAAWSAHFMCTVDLADRLHTNKYLEFLKVIGNKQVSYIGQGKMNDTSYAVLRKQFNIYK